MSNLHFPPWICAVPLCRTTHTVEEALGCLHQSHAAQLVLTTDQDHAFAIVYLKDLLWGLASRTLRLEQTLGAVPLHHPLCLLLLADHSPQAAWWSVWKRLGHPDRQIPALEYGFINLEGDFLGLLDYGEFLDRLVEYCPGNSLKPLPQTLPQDRGDALPPSPPASLLEQSLQHQIAEVFLTHVPGLLAENHQLHLENQYKTILLDRLGHDLKTPVTSIIGLATLLKEQSANPSPSTAAPLETLLQRMSRQGYYGQVIYQNSRYLMSLVNRLMELARLETQQKVPQPHAVSLQPLLQTCWNQAQEEVALRAPPQSQESSPCPEVDAALQIWGDRESSELLLTLFLAHGLESQTAGQTLSLRALAWGAALPGRAPWLILTLDWVAPEQGKFDDPGAATLPFSDPNVLEPLDLWIARRFAQWQGGDLNYLGNHLDLLLPQTPLSLETPTTTSLDPTFVLVGLSNPQDWLTIDPLTVLKTDLQRAGIFMLFATDPDELIRKLQRFRPRMLLLDEAWTTGWETLSLYETLTGLDALEIFGITLQLVSEHPPVREILPLIDSFQLPQDFQRLRDCLWGQKPTLPPFPFGAPPATFLWLGQSGQEEQFSSLFPGCQILEAEDVEQAELLVQIWNIEAIVIHPAEAKDEEQTLSNIRQSSLLSPLRLISI
ncbi:MAG: hypothetical protein RLZZ435_3622 [Cyanobacteriota bacterium]|jgi:uncharacterized protein YcgL (UPF0745 family)